MRIKFVFLFTLLIINSVKAQTQTLPEFTWQDIRSVDFGSGANFFTIQAASSGFGGEVELRLDAADGSVIGRTFFHHTGDTGYFLPYECELTQTVSGIHDVYMNFLDYSSPDTGGVLQIGNFMFTIIEEPTVSGGDSLHIYSDVPGLAPSPYYDIYIQKVSELNSSNLNEVTNWKTPFAWFTQCPDYVSGADSKGYYSAYIGGWSNTYTNFELDSNTSVVIKIVRKNDTGDDAPAGAISSAAVRPAQNVDSWEIIDGDVYITLSNPTQLAVDIDKQMDFRVSPRATPTGWTADAFPYRSKSEGSHAVTIFANPFIKDKPNPNDPGVLVVKAGEKIPSTEELENLEWDILYFEPGIHKASVDVDTDGNLIERKWQADDPITLQDNKSYYIPGDAIVYGNFTDINRSNSQSVNIRIFGHGTISGSKINHNKVEGEAYSNEGWWNRALYLRNAENCHFEGITAVDPAFHTLCIGSTVNKMYEANTIKWAKVIAWRTNSDGTSVGGNVEMEDCFIRCQDDGHYIGGTTIMKRVIFWHDVNGQTFRSDFSNRRYSQDNAPNIPDRIIYEDIDLIYQRGVFTTSDNGYGIIGVGSDRGSNNEILAGGVENTGQMILFRNIRMSDPHPTRNLFSFDLQSKVGDYAGFRFENVDYQGTQVFGWRNKFQGGNDAIIRNFVFDNVTISGEKMDQKMVNDHFIADNPLHLTYRKTYLIASTNRILTTTATNGGIIVDTTGGIITVTALPKEGYEFIRWSGDLSGTDSTQIITMDSDKSITAIFHIKTFTISTSPVTNVTIIIEPEADTYDYGTPVTIICVADLGYGLDSWGGDLSGSEDTLTITMDSDKSISATTKTVPTYTLNIDTKYGSVELDPPGGIYNTGTVVTLKADPVPNYYFEQWLGDASGIENPKEIIMNDNKTVNARFVYSGYGIVSSAINFGGSDYVDSEGISYTGNLDGSKYSTTADINGTADDSLYQSERYGNFIINIPVINGNYQVTLKFAEIYFTSSGQRVFDVSLEGDIIISNLDIFAKVGANTAYDEIHEVNVVDGNISISFEAIINNPKISAIQIKSQEFEGETFTLEINNSSKGNIEAVPVKGFYPAGSNVQLTATPHHGYILSEWTGDVTGSENPTTIYLDANKTVSALFTELPTYTLSINAINGSVTLDPEGGTYHEGTVVNLTAIPDSGYEFGLWTGDITSYNISETVTMTGNKTVSATFIELPKYTITTEAINGSIELIPAGGQYYEGTEVSLYAIPESGWEFINWTGDLSGSSPEQTIIMTSNFYVSAVFNSLTDNHNIISDKLSQTNEILFYPNPVSDKLFIEFSKIDKYREVRILNSLGQLIYLGKAIGSNKTIPIEKLNCKGLIYVQVISNNNISVFKILTNSK